MRNHSRVRSGSAPKMLLLVALFWAVSCLASEEAFRWSGGISPSTIAAGDTARLRIRLDIDSGHYVYKHMTSVSGLLPKGLSIGSPAFSPPISKLDGVTGEVEEMYVDSLLVSLPAWLTHAAQPGSLAFRMVLRYQGCTQSLCYLPAADTLSFSLLASTAGLQAAGARAALPEDEKGLAGQMGRGGVWALLFAFVAGLLTSFTPCVYPLIPVTVAIFGAHAARSRLRSFLLSAVYVGGMALVFSLLGFAAARTGAVFGQVLGNVWVVILLVAVFCVFAISLFGAFDFQLPSGIQTRINVVSGGGKGFWRTFFMGAVAGFIAAPCTGPSLAAILTYVARSGNEGFGFAMLLCFALGLGLPFLLLGTFSSLVAARPKPGSWMEAVKSILGVAVLAVAVHILLGGFPLLRQQIALANTYLAAGIVMGIAGLAMGAIHLSYHSATAMTVFRKTAGILLLVLSAYVIMVGITGTPPAVASGKKSDAAHKVAWEKDLRTGLARAKAEGRPAFIDYTAEWCIACKELERYTFSDSAVVAGLERFICIKVDLTENTPPNKALSVEQHIAGLPTLDFYDSGGRRLGDKRILGFIGAEEFLKHFMDIE